MASATSRRLQPDLIEGWNPPSRMPAPNDHLRFRINVSVSQAALISDVMVSGAIVMRGALNWTVIPTCVSLGSIVIFSLNQGRMLTSEHSLNLPGV